jgi:hypothetical protein
MTVRGSRPHGKASKDEESSGNTRQWLLTQRAALILVTALVIGLIAGTLEYLAGDKLAEAVLTGGGCFGGAIALLNTLIN